MNISRRDFLKGIGVATAGLLIDKSAILKAVESMSPKDTAAYWIKPKEQKWVLRSGDKEQLLRDLGQYPMALGSIRVWNRCLSLKEVQKIYAMERGRYGV